MYISMYFYIKYKNINILYYERHIYMKLLFLKYQGNGQILGVHNQDNENKLELRSPTESQRFQSHLQLQLNQISHPIQEQPHNNISKFQNVFTERDFDFVSNKYL